MKIIESYVFEVGDVFEVRGEADYLLPLAKGYVLVSSVDNPNLGFVTLRGDGKSFEFKIETIKGKIDRGNLIYIGNTIRGFSE